MLYDNDPWLNPFKGAIDARKQRILAAKEAVAAKAGSLYDAANNHLYYALHKEDGCWVFREWAPSAVRIYLIGDFNGWRKNERFALRNIGGGTWELKVPVDEIEPFIVKICHFMHSPVV